MRSQQWRRALHAYDPPCTDPGAEVGEGEGEVELGAGDLTPHSAHCAVPDAAQMAAKGVSSAALQALLEDDLL